MLNSSSELSQKKKNQLQLILVVVSLFGAWVKTHANNNGRNSSFFIRCRHAASPGYSLCLDKFGWTWAEFRRLHVKFLLSFLRIFWILIWRYGWSTVRRPSHSAFMVSLWLGFSPLMHGAQRSRSNVMKIHTGTNFSNCRDTVRDPNLKL